MKPSNVQPEVVDKMIETLGYFVGSVEIAACPNQAIAELRRTNSHNSVRLFPYRVFLRLRRKGLIAFIGRDWPWSIYTITPAGRAAIKKGKP